ncbi:MAG: L-histidine N(alpha)-methyltransferase [Terracidiphilus sp.]
MPRSASSAEAALSERVASAVRDGLATHPRSLPPWLFYDEAGSHLFEQITRLPEYYLTRTERSILAAHAPAILAQAAQSDRVRIAELGAGSADKTRLLLAAAVAKQTAVHYEPVDVSASALDLAASRIAREMPAVTVAPRVMDYTHHLALDPLPPGERWLVLHIGSSIGNFEPAAAAHLLSQIRAALAPGDALLLGVDMVKDTPTLLAAYDDPAGVTAAFNRNLLVRLNRELDADFRPEAFAHRALWNGAASRIEMHLESLAAQSVRIGALNLTIRFSPGERIHTENSYKYRPGEAEALLSSAAFCPEATWTDPAAWFNVLLARAA